MIGLPTFEADDAGAPRGLGELRAGAGTSPFPLRAVDLRAQVAGLVAEVELCQRFANPFPDPVEAVYVFPLAGDAAVTSFELRVGERRLAGEVAERAEARRTYAEGLAAGHRAALLEQERDDVFTLQVGNVAPGEEVEVRLTTAELLPFRADGTAELRLPLVVGIRYVPGTPLDRDPWGDGVEPDTDQVPDASRVTPPRLARGLDPGVELTLAVELLHRAGESVTALACSQHATCLATGPGRTTIELARGGERLDRDFVLRWRVARETVRPVLLAGRGPEGERPALLTLLPPPEAGRRRPRDVVFLVDRSGSMSGAKMVAAARAGAALLASLAVTDRFALLAFDTEVESPDATPVLHAATPEAVARGERFLRTLEGRGGTELLPALEEALRLVAGLEEGRDASLVVLTDGQVANDGAVLAHLQRHPSPARVFTVGVDTAVNRPFLERLARLGRGSCRCVEPGAIDRALGDLAREIGTPLVEELALGRKGVVPGSVAPEHLPDLFAGQAVHLFLALTPRAAGVALSGRAGDGEWALSVAAEERDLAALGALWARARVRDLEDRLRLAAGDERAALREEIVELSCRHRILTRFTAWVLVDRDEVVAGHEHRRRLVQPVEVPAEWEEDAAQAEEPGCRYAPCRSASREWHAETDHGFDDVDLPAVLRAQLGARDAFAPPPAPRPAAPNAGEVLLALRRWLDGIRARLPAGGRLPLRRLAALRDELAAALESLPPQEIRTELQRLLAALDDLLAAPPQERRWHALQLEALLAAPFVTRLIAQAEEVAAGRSGTAGTDRFREAPIQ